MVMQFQCYTRSGRETNKCANMRLLPTAIAILSVVLAMLLLVLLAQRIDHVPFAVNDSLDDTPSTGPWTGSSTNVEQAAIAVGAVLLLFCVAAYILSPQEARRERMRKAEKLSDDLFPVDPDPDLDIVDPDPEL